MVPLMAAKRERISRPRLKESDRRFLTRIIAEWLRWRIHEIENKYGRELEELERLEKELIQARKERRFKMAWTLRKKLREGWKEIRPKVREDEIEWGLALLKRMWMPARGRPDRSWVWNLYRREERARVLREAEEAME